MTWQPWGSEPQDGTEFLAYRPDAGVMICWWVDFVEPALLEVGGDDLTADQPTHWMPLPKPPDDDPAVDGPPRKG